MCATPPPHLPRPLSICDCLVFLSSPRSLFPTRFPLPRLTRNLRHRTQSHSIKKGEEGLLLLLLLWQLRGNPKGGVREVFEGRDGGFWIRWHCLVKSGSVGGRDQQPGRPVAGLVSVRARRGVGGPLLRERGVCLLTGGRVARGAWGPEARGFAQVCKSRVVSVAVPSFLLTSEDTQGHAHAHTHMFRRWRRVIDCLFPRVDSCTRFTLVSLSDTFF